ncbi:MAG TPA: NAD-dependent epimerase/dehydratase family protein [Candidatus Limnocylindria bacterium]|nr:NAD-dependent epimerase/dehydratase family protein [Candidatus Limnocylindria bacterium]
MAGGVAIVGAGGFVGARLLEMTALAGRTDVVPIVRAFRSVGRSAHLGVRHRIADALRPDTLTGALAGCDVVVNLTTGRPSDIVAVTRSVYDAAVAVGARTVVHMSSAAVYGQVDRPGLPDDAPPPPDHWMPYARQKGLAESFLRARMGHSRPAIVVLRPSLVWGPGSPWVLGPANEILSGSAYLVGDGAGVCNLMYVDNLVRSILAVVDDPEPAPGFFHVGDDADLTWREYYAALAAGLGVDAATIHAVAMARYRIGPRDALETLRSSPAYTWLKERIPLETRSLVKLRLARGRRGAEAQPNARPTVTRAMWDLQTTRYPLPTDAFRAAYGHHNETSFASGLSASLEWLGFIGVRGPDRPAMRPN